MPIKINKTLQNLYEAILCLKDVKELHSFMQDLTTLNELDEFCKRWVVAQMLDRKVPYTDIVIQTGMSTTTIARVSKCLNGEVGGYRLVLDRNQEILNAKD